MGNKICRGRFALALLALAAARAADDTPGWLKELTGASLPPYSANVNSVVLLNEERTTAAESRRLTTGYPHGDEGAPRQGGDILFFDHYDSRSGKVRDFRAWMVAPSGKVKKYGKDEIVDIACAEN